MPKAWDDLGIQVFEHETTFPLDVPGFADRFQAVHMAVQILLYNPFEKLEIRAPGAAKLMREAFRATDRGADDRSVGKATFREFLGSDLAKNEAPNMRLEA